MYRTLVRLAVTAFTVTAILIIAVAPALAAPAPPPPTYDLYTVIEHLRYWVAGILGAVATLFLTIGGARYLMAGGDPSEVERAKGSFKSAAIGYGLALLAPVIMTILNGILRP
ncbi:hypothetical protein Pa4123_81130 [Phytohabitans aurantiacus]|jgi:hypothetical protein|uniref:TrbC/VIRB2 family protein n=1 Tax=Phytohabitans aurantiacus TaxID=3016789 RepID=A0ABQ5R848_9ACTN|nr:pilin [Phytohabitans aurantiacus]GLI02835.1 hypothetical protein Pa4123_81130 [Phytohabitans aurantiacus]